MTSRQRCVAVLLVAGVLAAAGCSSPGRKADAGSTSPAPQTTGGPTGLPSHGFVSRAGDLALAIVPGDQGQVMAYVCDGRTVSDWFFGPFAGSHLRLSSDRGATLAADLSGTSARAAVSLEPGVASNRSRPQQFSLQPASGSAGLFRSARPVAGHQLLAGWIVQNDQGAVGNVMLQGEPTQSVAGAPALDLITLRSNGGGTVDGVPFSRFWAAQVVAKTAPAASVPGKTAPAATAPGKAGAPVLIAAKGFRQVDVDTTDFSRTSTVLLAQ